MSQNSRLHEQSQTSLTVSSHGDDLKTKVQRAIDKLVDAENFNRVAKNLKVVSASADGIETELVLRHSHLNRKGTLHGGLGAALVDILTDWAVGLIVERLRLFSVELSVSYLNRAVDGETIVIDSKCLRVDERTAYAEAEIRRKSNREIIARGKNTLAIVHKK